MDALVLALVMLAVIFVPVIWVLALYNRLVRVRNCVEASWSGIDTELKRRHELIPNLVETVKGYAAHERETLERVLAARSAAMAQMNNRRGLSDNENALAASLGRLVAVAEAIPELKADRHFLELQEDLSLTEDRIQRARRFFNGNVREMNDCVQAFPTNILAGMFGFREMEYFQIDELARRPVQVDLPPAARATERS